MPHHAGPPSRHDAAFLKNSINIAGFLENPK